MSLPRAVGKPLWGGEGRGHGATRWEGGGRGSRCAQDGVCTEGIKMTKFLFYMHMYINLWCLYSAIKLTSAFSCF